MHETKACVLNLLPGHGHVFHELDDGVRHKLERAQVHALVVAELAIGHVAVVRDNLAHVLRRHVLLLRVHHACIREIWIVKRKRNGMFLDQSYVHNIVH